MSFLNVFKKEPSTPSLKEVCAPSCVAIGELMWEITESATPGVPNVQQVGGAPANFAFYAHELGAKCELVSSVGVDPSGDSLLKQVAKLNLSVRGIQRCRFFPTGAASIHLREDQVPEYKIHTGVAWDDIEETQSALSMVQHTELIYYGTLALRSEKSRSTIMNLVEKGKESAHRVLDLNILEQNYAHQTILGALKHATILKLNEEDATRLSQTMMLPPNHEPLARGLFQRFRMLQLIAVTRGEEGSTLFAKDGGISVKDAHPVKVIDTSGAGDAFCAVIALGWHRHMELVPLHQLANEVAGYVCSVQGSCPHLPKKFRTSLGY